MNILFVAHERNLGGASKSLVTLAEEMQKKGNKVVVVLPFKSGQVYSKLKCSGIPVYKIVIEPSSYCMKSIQIN